MNVVIPPTAASYPADAITALPVPVAQGGTGGTTAATARDGLGASAGIFPAAVLDMSGVTSTPRLLPLRDIVSILADSANTQYERHPSLPSVIQLKALTLGTISDAIATVPAGATLTNGSALASATASGDTLTMNHATSGGGEFYGGDGSAPNYNWTYTRGNGKHGVVFHMAASDIDTAGNGIRVGIATSAGNVGAMLDFYNGGARAFRYIVNGTTSATIASRSQAEVATGTWCWIEYDEAAATIALRYKHASSASEPADAGDWTLAHRAAVISSTTSSWLRVIALTNGASGTYVNATVTGMRTYGERAPKELPGSTPTPTRRSFGGFAPTADVVALFHASEATAWLPDLTLNRLALADAVNRLPGDAGTVTWALVGSDTSLAACVPFDAGSYAAAASVVRTEPVAGATITTAKLYWKLWVKVVSASGFQAASIDLARIPGLYAA